MSIKADRSYAIMSGDTLVAVWENSALRVANEALLPLYLIKRPCADSWLESRAADHRRPNIRLLKKALCLAEKDDVSAVIHVNSATRTLQCAMTSDEALGEGE